MAERRRRLSTLDPAPVAASGKSAARSKRAAPAHAAASPPRVGATTPRAAAASPHGSASRPRPTAGSSRATAAPKRVSQARGRLRAVPARDEFGLDPEFRARAMPLFRLLYEKYWRVEAQGTRNVPRSGPVILVGNHSGAIPFDATMIACALEEAGHPRPARFLYDRFVENLPWIPEFYRRAGGVLASHANAERLLEKGELVGLFPEGVAGLSKLYSERYVLQPFSSGFVRLALRYHAPIVPVAVIGAEEIYPLVGRVRAVGQLLGIPYLPVTPFFPLLGPLGMIPLPTKWTIRFGKPIILSTGTQHRPDGTAVRAMAERTRERVQQMVRQLLRRREHVF
jgi:1-acyl-sn-glycerol-3-phosphate acyltransferase